MQKTNLPLFVIAALANTLAFATDAGDNKTRITTGDPEQDGKVTVEIKWKSDGGTSQTVKVECDILATDTPTQKAEKLATCIQDKIEADFPTASDQGARADQAMAGKSPLPEVIVQNKQGFKLEKVKITDDKTKEKEDIDVLSVSLRQSGINSAIDLYGAPMGGTVAVTIGTEIPIVLNTNGMTTGELEQAIAVQIEKLGYDAVISSSELISDFQDPAFDGSEIQLPLLDAPSFSVDIDDNNIGVKYELSFDKPVPTLSVKGLMVLGLSILLGGGFITYRLRLRTSPRPT